MDLTCWNLLVYLLVLDMVNTEKDLSVWKGDLTKGTEMGQQILLLLSPQLFAFQLHKSTVPDLFTI